MNLMFTEEQYTMHYGRDTNGDKSRIVRIVDNINGRHIYLPVHVLEDMLSILKEYIEDD